MNIEIIIKHGGRTVDSDGVIRWEEPKTYRGLLTYFHDPKNAKKEVLRIVERLLGNIPELEGDKK